MSVEVYEVRVERGRPPYLAILALEGNQEAYTEGFLISPNASGPGVAASEFAMCFRANLPPERTRAVAVARLHKLVWDLNIASSGAVDRVEFVEVTPEWISAHITAGLYPDLLNLNRKSRMPGMHTFLGTLRQPAIVELDFD
ncbi:hypothetical protein [Variovorax sp. 38R]|uniref:hypothetical protein n=1 Tax=Variovorax sp. 38R TaxID=2774875 RepID=UPI0017860F5E|nr:hypothetical protein [Variovorax sp. 38R]QOF76077.1 hypothetical protein IG196_16840 [Variovorax sp. 38R]